MLRKSTSATVSTLAWFVQRSLRQQQQPAEQHGQARVRGQLEVERLVKLLHEAGDDVANAHEAEDLDLDGNLRE